MRFLLLALLFGTGFISPPLEGATITGDRGSITVGAAGSISEWVVGGKELIRGNTAPPLSFSYLPPGEGEQRVPPRTASFRAGKAEEMDGGRLIRISGEVSDGGTVLASAVIEYDLSDIARPRISVSFTRAAGAPPVLLREAAWSLPLSIDHRKRIFYHGDYGMDWDTRYFYQFMTDSPGRVLRDPERNEWKHFCLDYLSPEAFHLWRAESDTTSPLTMQSGLSAPGFVQVYDQEKGVALIYPDAARDAPKSLRVFAPDGGTLLLEFWPSTAVPISLDSELADTLVFGRVHRFELAGSSTPDEGVMLREEAGKLAKSSPKPDPEHALMEPLWLRQTPVGQDGLVTGGYPFAEGELKADSKLEVTSGNVSVPAQTRVLGYWPDGSVKWMLLSFPLAPLMAGSPLREGPPPAGRASITLRSGNWLPMEIRPMVSGKESSTALATRTKDGVVVKTGAMQFVVREGAMCVQGMQIGQRAIFSEAAIPFLSATWLKNPQQVLPAEYQVTGGEIQTEAFLAETVTVEEEGPYRAVIKLEGHASSEMRVTLRLEVFAGSTQLRVTQTSEFLQADPRKTFLAGLVFRLPVSLGEAVRATVGVEDKDVSLPAGRDFSILQLQPDFFRVESAADRHSPLQGRRSQGWMQIVSEKGTAFVGIRNFWQMAPKAVAYDGSEGILSASIWPREAPPMDVRRYSDFPHRSQGESVTSHNDWVESTYYPNDPFAGISRTNEVIFDFGDVAGPRTLMADFQSPPLLYAGWDRYAATGITLPGTDRGEAPRLWRNLDALTRFWLHHQELHGWSGFWNYGNMGNYFRGGYGWLLEPDELRRMLKESVASPNLRADRSKRKADYFPQNDWAYDNGRWGWQNTEGLANLFFQNQYLRTGGRALYFASEAMARQSRDVILRHSGKWMGRGTRHGVQAWSDGNHEERQGSPTEFKLNYFLSGDGRTRDVEEHMYRNYYTKTDVTVDAAHSARLGALLMHWEMTNDLSEAEVLQKYVESFCSPDGLYVTPQVRFPGAASIAPPQDLNSGSMFFHTFGGMHAIIEYYQITKNAKLRDAIIKMADAALKDQELVAKFMTGKISSNQLYWPAIAFAARYAQEPEKYRDFIRQYVARSAWKLAYNTVTQSSRHWSGNTAGLETNVSGSWFWTNWAQYFLMTVPEDEMISPEVEAGIQARERDGFPSRRIKESWQSELDEWKDLQFYLGRDRPWDPASAKADGGADAPLETAEP